MEYKLSDDTWDNLEYNAINRVIQSGRFTMGIEVKNFELKWAEKFGVKYAVMSNSGSSANLLAIAALVYSGHLKKGDEVIVPAVSWSTTYYPLTQFGLKIRFVDIDPNTLNLNILDIENSITPLTRAILAVNLLGNPNDFSQLSDICSKNKFILIEDNCESLGAKFDEKECGTFGIVGTYSTFYSHHLCTMEGGITVTNDSELYEYMLSIRAHGWTRNLPQNSKIYTKNVDDFYESFNFIVPGFNLRPLEIEAAIGIEQLDKVENIILNRRENARYFVDKISKLNGIRIQKEIGKSSWFGFAMILENKNIGRRNIIIEALKNANIEVRPIVAGNFTRNPVIKYLDYSIYGKLQNADDIHMNGFFVGNHSKNNFNEIDHLYLTLKSVLL